MSLIPKDFVLLQAKAENSKVYFYEERGGT